MHREGFWRPSSAASSQLPFPQERPKAWKGKRELLQALIKKEGNATRIAVAGRDECLLCSERLTRTEFWVLGQWKWPASLYHYVKIHHVRPSLGFHEFVVGRELK